MTLLEPLSIEGLPNQPTDPLDPVKNNARPSRVTATAGTEIGQVFPFQGSSFPQKTGVTTKSLRLLWGLSGSGLRPLTKILNCCFTNESGPCLSAGEADLPLRTARLHTLWWSIIPHDGQPHCPLLPQTWGTLWAAIPEGRPSS